MDKIIISNLKLSGIIGINDDERVNEQDILVNLVMFADTRPAAASDNIRDAVNYRTVTKHIIRHVQESADFLVERLAADIARLVLAEYAVERVIVRVEKPGAVRFAESVGVEIERTRADFPG
jgi:FolB domain-containing protein